MTPWTAGQQASLFLTISWSLLKLMSIKLMMPFNHLILCQPLLILPSIFPSIKVFSKSTLCIRWSKYWSFSFTISPSNEYPELISFGIDWFDLLAVQGTLKSLLQRHSSKASTLQCSASLWSNFHIHTWLPEKPQLWLYEHLLSKRCLLFNTLSRFVMAFLPRSKCLLFSWLESLFTVILEAKKIKSVTISNSSPFICHKVMGPDATISFLECWVLNHFLLLSTFMLIKRLFSSFSLFGIWFVSSEYVIRSDQISCSVVSDSLQPHESQHARPPCQSPTPGVHSDSGPSSQWCHPAISSSVVPFSSFANPSQHQSLFQWVNSSHEVAKVLEFQL